MHPAACSERTSICAHDNKPVGCRRQCSCQGCQEHRQEGLQDARQALKGTCAACKKDWQASALTATACLVQKSASVQVLPRRQMSGPALLTSCTPEGLHASNQMT